MFSAGPQTRRPAFAILDAFLDAGFNAIDTADVYSIFVPGHIGGESEIILGEWMKDRGVRDRVVLITKGGLGMGEGLQGLSAATICTRACDASLKRLQTDYIDVYFTHQPAEETPDRRNAGYAWPAPQGRRQDSRECAVASNYSGRAAGRSAGRGR